MNQKIEPTVFFSNRLKSRINFSLIRHIARQNKRVFHRGGQFFDIPLQSFALICKSQLRAVFQTSLSASPRNRTLISDTEDHSNFIFKHIFFLSEKV